MFFRQKVNLLQDHYDRESQISLDKRASSVKFATGDDENEDEREVRFRKRYFSLDNTFFSFQG